MGSASRLRIPFVAASGPKFNDETDVSYPSVDTIARVAPRLIVTPEFTTFRRKNSQLFG
jgi:hypothetical protein